MVQQGKDRPIGYWIRRADELLTLAVDRVQGAHGLSRLEWQALNVFHDAGGAAEFSVVAEQLRPFADTPALVECIERLVQRELIVSEGPDRAAYRLTAAGRRLHEQALKSQTEFRRRAFDGVSEQDYATTVRVLQKLVENLERWAEHP